MARHTFTGAETQVYPQYLDAEHGRTLVAEHGHAYEISPAEGLTVDLPVPPGDGRWKATRARTEPKED